MTDLTLDHETCLRLATDAENWLLIISERTFLTSICWSRLTRSWLHRWSERVVQIEAECVLLLDKLHVLLEYMQRCVGFAKQLLPFPHPVFVAPEFLFEICSTMRLAVEIFEALDDIPNMNVCRPLAEVAVMTAFDESDDLSLGLSVFGQYCIHLRERIFVDGKRLVLDLRM